MNIKYLTEKLGHIDDDLIEEAATSGADVKEGHTVRRNFFAILAAAILILASFSTALAVNADFRAAVISFFKLISSENIPQNGNDAEAGKIHIYSTSNIDGLVNINYLKFDENYEYNDGVIFTYNETDGFTRGAYYCVEGDKLISLKTKRAETSFDCRGYTWSVRFDYAVIDGKLYIHNIPNSRMPEDNGDISCYASAMKDGSLHKVLLTLPFPHASLKGYSEYYVIFDIGTGKITDFLNGCGFDKLTDFVHKIDFNDDLTRAIVTTYDSVSFNGYKEVYYCDVAEKKLIPVKEVTKEEIASDGEPKCWLLDDNTLFYYTKQSSDGQKINLKTGERLTAYTGLKPYTDSEGGLQFLGGRYALDIKYDRKVSLLDLLTGIQTPIDSFKFTSLTGATLNADKTKVFFMMYDDLKIGYLGVLDIQKSKLVLLERKGQEVRSEHNVEWFDNNRISVNATEDRNEKYLYLYEFND